VRTCVIFNPVARGNKARHFRQWLNGVAFECTLKPTTKAGEAQRLGAEAVAEGFELIIAAGGDGTVNEVLNGIGDSPNGFERARLGVLPLGTVNVFAREIGLPLKVSEAWKVLQAGSERWIDVPLVEFGSNGSAGRRYFVQLAGAGLDARAIELVSWKHKKQVGPLAYVIAGLKALREQHPRITVRADGQEFSGQLVLTGNGRYYGGSFAVFPEAKLEDGFMDVCCIPKTNFPTLLRCAPGVLFQGRVPESQVRRVRTKKFELSAESRAAFELDGEWVGHLPATFSLGPQKIRVIAP
jgi:YegS/Rv2252/BmrU family lipid kinase